MIQLRENNLQIKQSHCNAMVGVNYEQLGGLIYYSVAINSKHCTKQTNKPDPPLVTFLCRDSDSDRGHNHAAHQLSFIDHSD